MKLQNFKNENGQAMVEFALVLPILLLFIAGIIDFGWIFHNQLAANNASREAARYIAIHYYFDNMDGKTPDEVGSAENIAKAKIEENVTAVANINVENIDILGDDANGGEKIKVKFTGDVVILTPFLSTVLGDNIYTIGAESTMRVEK